MSYDCFFAQFFFSLFSRITDSMHLFKFLTLKTFPGEPREGEQLSHKKKKKKKREGEQVESYFKKSDQNIWRAFREKVTVLIF